MAWFRYVLYFFGIASLTALLVQLEVANPGTLRLQEFVAEGDTYGTSEFSVVEIVQLLLLLVCGAMMGWVAQHSNTQRPLAILFGGLALIFAGAVILFAYSILVGHEPLWQAMLGDAYARIIKLAVEEFIELIGYLLWLIGTIEYVYQSKALIEREPKPAAAKRREYRRRH
jgi:hypothetical protein